MKIAILTPTFFEFSGIDRVAEQQAIENVKQGNKVTIFCFKSTIKPKGYSIIELGMPKNLFWQRIYRLLFFLDKRKIQKTVNMLKNYELMISHMYPMNLLASKTKKKHKVRYLFHNHGVGHPKLFKNFFEIIYMKIFIFLNNNSLKNVDKAVSISKFMQAELKRESGINSQVVYNEIDSKKFNKKIRGTKIIKKHNLKGNKVLLFVGRLSPHKGVDLLLKAFSEINKEIDNVKLIIIGKPTFSRYYDNLKSLANKNVIFLESVNDEDLPYYYAASDIYVTCSLWEGFDLPAAEAQACGKKVVAFDIGSHPEIVKKGVLIKEKDLKQFSKAIIQELKKKK